MQHHYSTQTNATSSGEMTNEKFKQKTDLPLVVKMSVRIPVFTGFCFQISELPHKVILFETFYLLQTNEKERGARNA
jgi:hypothetical protein